MNSLYVAGEDNQLSGLETALLYAVAMFHVRSPLEKRKMNNR